VNDHTSATLSLREAIEVANGDLAIGDLSGSAQKQITGELSNPNAIDFDILGMGLHTISPQSALPDVTAPVVIDGTTQTGFAGTALIVLDGIHVQGSASGLVLKGGASTARALVIDDFFGNGILLSGAGGDLIAGCYIGVDATGAVAAGNGALSGSGIEVNGTPDNTIGGTAASEGNIISGNRGLGIALESAGSGNVIEGNGIGVDASGANALPNNGPGIYAVLTAAGNTISGITPGAGNVISGNHGSGISLTNTGAFLIAGNEIGTSASGASALPNQGDGIDASAASAAATIGGTTQAARNIISGNAMNGVLLGGTGDFTDLVQGNYIGPDAAGAIAMGNADSGIDIQGTPQNTIGGTVAHAGNLISANGTGTNPFRKDGITLESGSPGASANLIQGNLIGTDLTGTANLGNAGYGIQLVHASNITIGGPVAGAANAIAFNRADGVRVNGGIDNLITANAISANTGAGIGLIQGGNEVQAAPILGFTPPSEGGEGTLAGTLAAAANGTYTIEIFSNSTVPAAGDEQGQTFLTAISVPTDGSGNGSFSLPDPADVYTVTATDTAGNTSAFSNAAGTADTSAADLAVTVGVDSGPVTVGSNLDYTFTIQNHGTVIATGVTLTHMLPSTVSFVSATASQGTAIQSAGTLTARIGTLMGDSHATVGVVAQPQAIGSIDVTANVITDQGLLDPSQGMTTIPISVSPGPPTSLDVNRSTGASGSPTLSLNWSYTVPPGSSATYTIYRGETPGSEGNVPYATGVTTKQYTDAGALANRAYYYQVSAVLGGLESPHSNEASGDTLTASTLSATTIEGPAGDGQIDAALEYTSTGGDAPAHNIYRATTHGGEGATPFITRVNADRVFLPQARGSTYYYEITAVAGSHESSRSNEVKVIVPPLAAPVLSAMFAMLDLAGGSADFALDWTSPEPAASNFAFNIYRSTSPGR
jgi:uncharacterized repeat protein (TIGR01451 family)